MDDGKPNEETELEGQRLAPSDPGDEGSAPDATDVMGGAEGGDWETLRRVRGAGGTAEPGEDPLPEG